MILTITIILLLFFLWLPKPAFAFDTGHHSDLTREALQNEGFKETPIQIVQVENWLVDYYSSWPDSFAKKFPSGVKDVKEAGVEKLHFDNLFKTDDISNYWMWLTVNTKQAIQKAAKEEDKLKLLTLLGVSLHAVQDFYSHSNWVETHPSSDSNSYSSVTWFDSPSATKSELYTGYYPDDKKDPKGLEPHGSYDYGMNKDSYVRKDKNWEQAYVFAYAASRQWVNAAHIWVDEVNPTFWIKVQSYSTNHQEALDEDLEAARCISAWVNWDDQDGHWKGNGSGSSLFYPKLYLWARSNDSPFVKEFKKTKSSLLPLVEGLKSDGSEINPPNTDKLTVPPISLDQKAIIVKTVQVEGKDRSSSKNERSFYGKIMVDGQTFVEAVQQRKANISPHWTTIKFVPSTTDQVPIRYELFDEPPIGKDEEVDINPTGKSYLDFKFAVSSHENTGDIKGINDSPENAVTSEGRDLQKRAIIKFFITARPLQGYSRDTGKIGHDIKKRNKQVSGSPKLAFCQIPIF